MANVLTPAGGIFRPPRGGRLVLVLLRMEATTFLSTPSARRATYECFKRRIKPNVFLSTPSARRATRTVSCPCIFW